MCAIVGWAGHAKRGQWPLVHRLLSELLIASACRGVDATGFAALDRKGKLLTDKHPLPSRAFVRTSQVWRRLSSSCCLIGHCRAATHGSPFTADNRNNHPFVGHRTAVVVNGVQPNYRNVANRIGLPLSTECDSEIVLRIVETAEDPASGLRACLDHLDGGMAVAALDMEAQHLWLARNSGRPVWLLRLVGVEGMIACSTQEIAEHALRATFGIGYASAVAMLMSLASNSVIGITSLGRTWCHSPDAIGRERSSSTSFTHRNARKAEAHRFWRSSFTRPG